MSAYVTLGRVLLCRKKTRPVVSQGEVMSQEDVSSCVARRNVFLCYKNTCPLVTHRQTCVLFPKADICFS